MINGLMILAAPIFGAHYGVDIIAGISVAFVGIRLASGVARYFEGRYIERMRTGATPATASHPR